MKLTRIFSIAMALVVLMTCLLMAGCSTPEYAIDTTAINGKKYTTAEYLAYVYAIMTSDSTAGSYLYYLGEDAFDMDVTYEGETITLNEYILRSAKDTIVRQAVLEVMLKENNLTWDEEDLKTIEENLAELSTDTFIDLGFNNQRYIDMSKAVGLNETSLFYGLYGEGGSREVSDTDLRTFFDENHLSYKLIEISLVNDDKSEMTDEEIAAIQARMQKYLDAFNASEKTGTDFDKLVYAAYLADEEAAEEDEDSADDASTDETADNTTTDDAEEEEEVAATRYDYFKDDFSDEDLLKAIQAIPEGTAEIKTYQKSGTTKTMALIFRMDSEAERTEEDEDGNIVEVDYYEENRDTTLQYMKYEEFNEEVEAKIDELADTVTYNDRALKAPDLKEMASLVYGI